MPEKNFLETYPLYRKWKSDEIPRTTDQLPKVQINMHCPSCRSNQTFVMTNEYWEGEEYSNFPLGDRVCRVRYLCVHCQQFERFFFLRFDSQRTSVMKVGQFPAWEVAGNTEVERLLGEHSDYFKKGLISESQGYGIGAFGYYRRIVEEIIDQLLDEVSELFSEEEKQRYQEALAATKKTIVTQEKIDIVKDILPPILRPQGMNPLSVLHSALSEGLHAESDEACLTYAETVREVLVFLVDQVAASKRASVGFTENMRKLLDKRGNKSS